MNQAHLHLLVNHLPIIFPIVGVLVLIAGFVLKSAILKRTAFGIFMVGAITAFAAAATGEGAEHVLKQHHLAEMKVIHIHEELADTFAIISYLLGALSLVALWANWKQKSFAGILAIITLLVSGVAIVYGSNTGVSGGKVRHTEIRDGVTPIDSSAGNNHSEVDND
jgi:uncharacterized membrane protein